MKNTIILIVCLFAYSFAAFSCDPIFISFCDTSNEFDEAPIFLCKVMEHNNHNVDLEIIQILRGTESESTIRVWDGTDIDCNGIFPMDVSFYGQLGDTVICLVRTIDSLVNDWDIFGEYQRPTSISHQTFLPIHNGLLFAFDEQITYSQFLNEWEGNNCGLVSTQEFNQSEFSIFPNPTSGYLNIQSNNQSSLTYSLFSIDGRAILPKQILHKAEAINLEALNSGLYLIKIESENGWSTTQRFVKI